MKKGVSLTILVITIVVMLILAATAISNINKNNPLMFANEASFKASVGTLQEEINNTLYELLIENEESDINKTGEIEEFTKNKILLKKYSFFFTVVDGKCIMRDAVVGPTKYANQVKWARELGVKTMQEVAWSVMYKGFDGTVNRPDVAKGMIPVTYNEIDGKWHVAKPGNVAPPYWYDYKNQKWANAVFTKNQELREKILSSDGKSIKQEAVDAIIEMEDIHSMWVWIPRYSYKIYSLSNGGEQNVGKVDINFSEKLSEKTDDGFIQHKAFEFGNTQLSGFWFAKFQAGTDELVNNDTLLENANIYFKPDKLAVIDVSLKTAFEKCRMMEISNELGFAKETGYDFNIGDTLTENNNINIHLTKGLEYGAVAYLATSIYGKTGNEDYLKEEKEVYPNSNSGTYSTGYTGRSSGAASASKGDYKYSIAKLGTGASTTGNIYGVYDMAGRRRNILMSNHGNLVGESGFSVMPDKKYYDFVKTKGDATIETDGWYGDNVGRFDSYTDDRKNTWRVTGMIYDYSTYKTAGMFSYDAVNGAKSGYYYEKWDFRPAISVF